MCCVGGTYRFHLFHCVKEDNDGMEAIIFALSLQKHTAVSQ